MSFKGEVSAKEANISRTKRVTARVTESTTESKEFERSKRKKELFENSIGIGINSINGFYNVSSINNIRRNAFCNDVGRLFQREISPRAGAVAQLGEHHTCTVGVAGSNPVSSTIGF